MLYPDLGRLALARACATGGTHDAEAGGSNDPPPPKRNRPEGGAAGPAETEVMGNPDLVELILSAPGSGEACRLAVRWCASHKGACDDARWGARRKKVLFEAVNAEGFLKMEDVVDYLLSAYADSSATDSFGRSLQAPQPTPFRYY